MRRKEYAVNSHSVLIESHPDQWRTALEEIARELDACGVESELIFIGNRAVNGKINEAVKEVGEKMREADGLIIGSPVYYASPSGEVIAFLDRLFWDYGPEMACKPGAAVVSARRGGTTASFDVLNKYFTISQKPVVSSQYWNMVHGNTPAEVQQDAEGLQTAHLYPMRACFFILVRSGFFMLFCKQYFKRTDDRCFKDSVILKNPGSLSRHLMIGLIARKWNLFFGGGDAIG